MDGTQTYVILFNRDPDTALIETTETITLTGMNLPAGTKIRALGWSNSVSFNATASGASLTITAGQGVSANELIFEDEL